MTYLFSTINFYISKLFFKWFGIIFVGFTAIFALFEVVDVLRKMLSRNDIGISTFVELLILKLPQHIEILLPFLVLASVMMVLSRLNQKSEIIVLRAAGVSIWQVIWGIIVDVFILGIVFIAIFQPIKATMISRLYDLEDKLFSTQHAQVSLQNTGLWLKERTSEGDRLVHSLGVDLSNLHFSDISFYESNDHGHYKRQVMARQGILDQGQFVLRDVDIYVPGQPTHHFNTMSIKTEITSERIRDSNANPETMNLLQVMKLRGDMDKSGLSTLVYDLYIYKYFAKIGLMVVMVFLATSFCLQPPRTSRSGGLVGLCLLTGLVFHFLSDFVYALGLGGRVPPLVAVLSPVLIGGLLSLALLIHGDEARDK